MSNRKEYMRTWKKNNPDKVKFWREQDKKNNVERCRKYRNSPKGKLTSFRRELRDEYGITPEDFNRMLTEQNERCATCKRHKSEFRKRFAVDHCHDTGKVRGLLCSSCNRALGYLKEDVTTMQNLIEYTLKHRN